MTSPAQFVRSLISPNAPIVTSIGVKYPDDVMANSLRAFGVIVVIWKASGRTTDATDLINTLVIDAQIPEVYDPNFNALEEGLLDLGRNRRAKIALLIEGWPLFARVDPLHSTAAADVFNTVGKKWGEWGSLFRVVMMD